MKGRQEQAMAIGWNAEAFARTKRMKGLGEYLKPEPTVADKRQAGAAKVAMMLRRLEKRGDNAAP